MHRLHRWFLLARYRSQQRSTILDRGISADSFALTPEANSPPEFGTCIRVTSGAYMNASCTATAGGGAKAYEWHAAFGSLVRLEKTAFERAQSGHIRDTGIRRRNHCHMHR